MSISRGLPLPPPPKALRARSTSAATSAGSGLTASVPVSMPATSSRSDTNSCMWSAWLPMMRKNCRTTAGSRSDDESSTVAAEPLMEVRGARSSWLTMARNSARSRSGSSKAARSCKVTTKDSNVPSPERMGVALSSTDTLRPSGTRRTISSACTVSPALSNAAMGNSCSENSRPSARRKVTRFIRSTGLWPGSHRLATILVASRLKDLGRPVTASRPPPPPERCRPVFPGRPGPAVPPGTAGHWRPPEPPVRRTAPGSPRPPG